MDFMGISGHVEPAIKSYKQALALRPDFPEATCNLLHTLQVFKNCTLLPFLPLVLHVAGEAKVRPKSTPGEELHLHLSTGKLSSF